MIARETIKTREDLENAIFEALTVNASAEEENGKFRYYLHGDEETGSIYTDVFDDGINPKNVIFTAIMRNVPEDDDGMWSWESRENADFMATVRDIADEWEETFGKLER